MNSSAMTDTRLVTEHTRAQGSARVGIAHQLVVRVAAIKAPSELKLLLIADASGSVGLGFGLAKHGQEHPRENRDDSDDDEQFDEREAGDTDRAGRWFGWLHRSGRWWGGR